MSAALLLAIVLAAARVGPQTDAPHLDRLAARCGSELSWALNWDEAAARAESEEKLILVHALIYPGFRIADADRFGVFMDPDVVELVQERFVPLRLRDRTAVPFADPALYGLGPNSFGKGFLLVTPDGEVVADAAGDLLGLLLCGIRKLSPRAELATTAGEEDLDRAATHLRRGEHQACLESTSGLDGARAWLLRTKLHLRERNGEAAREALDEAGSSKDAARNRSELEFLRALLAARVQQESAAELFQAFIEEHPDHPRAPEAAYWTGALALVNGRGRPAALATWAGLFADHPDDRWAWKAAAVATGDAFPLGVYERVAWPDHEALRAAKSSDFAPLPGDRHADALRTARQWLLAHQRAEGSWGTTTEIGQARDDIPNEFTLAATALGAQALFGERDVPEVRDAIELALDQALLRYEDARRRPAFVSFLDYRVWSRAVLLAFLADVVRLGLREKDDLLEPVAALMRDLQALQHPDGGWSYYVTNDLTAASAPGQPSISFTTACVILALQDALDAGLSVPLDALERGLDALEFHRNEDGSFDYFGLPHVMRRPLPAGSAGRGPACTLALVRGGRAELEDLRQALERFFTYGAELGRERGKSMMHCGAEAQGSHYLFYDYATAARACMFLPPSDGGDRDRYRAFLRSEILQARGPGGAFLDNPLIGWAIGTGLAAQALGRLAEET